jgi:hypothetical protein
MAKESTNGMMDVDMRALTNMIESMASANTFGVMVDSTSASGEMENSTVKAIILVVLTERPAEVIGKTAREPNGLTSNEFLIANSLANLFLLTNSNFKSSNLFISKTDHRNFFD